MEYEFYILSRYLFLKIERTYNAMVEKSGITLPQLRVLWIITAFPGANSTMISKVGCWTRPTVTNIIKILIDKGLVEKDLSTNKKSKSIHITEKGLNIISINRQTNHSNFPLLKLLSIAEIEDINHLIEVYKYTTEKSGNTFILDYVEKINSLALKLQYSSFPESVRPKLESLVALYNLLRVFVLSVENEHSMLLKKMDITYPQMRALKIINAFKGITSLQLSEMALWSPSSANVVVKNLFKKGLISKDKGKVKNTVHMYSNEKAEKIIHKDVYENINKIGTLHLLNSVPNEKLNNLNKLLHHLNEEVNNHMVVEFLDKCLYPIHQH